MTVTALDEAGRLLELAKAADRAECYGEALSYRTEAAALIADNGHRWLGRAFLWVSKAIHRDRLHQLDLATERTTR